MAFTVQEPSDLARLLVEHPEWRLELRRLLLSDELLSLPELMRQLSEHVRSLAEAQRHSVMRLDWLKAHDKRFDDFMLEWKYRDKAMAYFYVWMRKVRVISPVDLEDALEANLSLDELGDVFLTDIIVRGRPLDRPELQEVLLAVEVAAEVDEGDVTRAARRAELMRRAGFRAIPVVVAEEITPRAQLEVQRQSVATLQDDPDEERVRNQGWNEALARWSAS